MTVTIRETEAPDAPKAPTYAQAMADSGATRFLFVSGQIPVRADLPVQIRADGMGAENLVRVTVALSDRRDIADDRRVRDEVPQGRRTGLTTIITATSEEGRLRPIEALAAA